MRFLPNWFSRIRRRQKEEPEEVQDDKIVVAEVLTVEKHPNADRLRVVKLQTGSEIIDPVVCGAFNFDVGDKVVLALPGAHIPQNVHSDTHEPFILGKMKIRGVESQGMIASAFELGLSNEPKRAIMVLERELEFGRKFSKNMKWHE